MARHKNKHIQQAIDYAELNGWRVVKASGAGPYLGKAVLPIGSKGRLHHPGLLDS